MKKLTLFFVSLILVFATVASVTFTACGGNEEKLEYTVTVLGEDEITGVSGVTVKWTSGSKTETAVTDESGKATATLDSASYEVTLENLPEGTSYSPATVTAASRGVTLVLSVNQVEYSATVTKHDGAPASGVTVTWRTASNTVAKTAVTDGNGKAFATLVYGNYSVTLSNLPEGSIFVGSVSVTGNNPNATFTLESGNTLSYSVTVKSEGGLIFKKCTVSAYLCDSLAATSETDEEGTATFLLPEGNYTVRVDGAPDGYSHTPAQLTAENNSADITLYSSIIEELPEAGYRYLIGDIFHDYEFTTPYQVNGAALEYKISEILKTKKAIILNFWGTNCSACMQEMPMMQEAYEEFKDDVEFLAVSNYMGGDSNQTIVGFHEQYGYDFPMFRDTYSFTSKFALKGWPTNVIIDKYGAIARIEEGALVSLSLWEKLIEPFISDDYVQTFVPGTDRNDSIIDDMAKPDVTVPENHYEKVGEAINNAEKIPAGCAIKWYGEPEESAEYTWPFLLGKAADGEDTVLYPSNTGHDYTFSFIYADITMTAGKVFAFDYWSQTEANRDRFYVLFDGKVAYTISGENDGWKTCYVYASIIDGEHQLALSYIKDSGKGAGFDNVYIKNARFVELSEITESTDMLRGAAYGVPATGSNTFPHYATVEKGDDGYYYVKLSDLLGAEYAGNDQNPMLFANFDLRTNWNPNLSIDDILLTTYAETGEYVFDMTFEYNGVTKDWRDLLIEYANLAAKSDIKGYLPVDDDLRGLLTAFTKHLSGDVSHENEWMELCYFFSHYGDGNPLGNPIIGLTTKTAIKLEEDERVTADLTRNIVPFTTTIYSFTPKKTGVYLFESFIPENMTPRYSAQFWIYTDAIDNFMYYSGADRIFRDTLNEQNFVSYLYLEEGTRYYVELAFLMAETGTYDFKVSYYGESAHYLEPCSSGDYVLNENGTMELRYAVKYGKDEDGYYHVLNSDGSLGDFIYMDFKYPTLANSSPLSAITRQWVVDPEDNTNRLYNVFDFSQNICYRTSGTDPETGEPIYSYGVYDIAELFEREDFKDYTAVMQAYSSEAMKNDGLLKVNDELVNIITLYFLLRTDAIINMNLPHPIPNEWLMFCWYDKTVDVNNPV